MGDIEQDDGSRYLYWAAFHGGDPQRPERVEFCIPGQGSGFYTRYAGDRVAGLLRYDRWADPAPSPTGRGRARISSGPGLSERSYPFTDLPHRGTQ